MAVVIRLRREGNKNRPFYRIVALNQARRRDGGYLENVGTYDPTLAKNNAHIDLVAVDKWVANGAQLSETVESLVKKARKALIAK
jgi:small subunit ribosomal protein S16